MKFSKLQATGNDFILIDARTPLCHPEPEISTFCHPKQTKESRHTENRLYERDGSHWSKLAQAMCRRHFGIGADGLILVQDSRTAALKMRIFNPDGSEAEACGNGLRCFAKYVIERGIHQPTCHPEQSEESHTTQGKLHQESTDYPPLVEVSIETLSGIRKAKAYISGDKVNQVEVNMGMPRFHPEQIPIKREVDIIPILDYPLVIGKRELTACLLSMGNPHTVSFLSGPVADFPLAGVGPNVERHDLFPQKTNFEIARVLSRKKIEARVWERGVGETLACGSGACAIAVAAHLIGLIDNQVEIILPGGSLTVRWDRGGEVSLAGPVEEVFAGEYLI